MKNVRKLLLLRVPILQELKFIIQCFDNTADFIPCTLEGGFFHICKAYEDHRVTALEAAVFVISSQVFFSVRRFFLPYA